MKASFPILYERKETCCGCSACAITCPIGAIQMVQDDEGFLYPKLDEQRCIKCYKCISSCFVKNMDRSN